MKKSIFVVMLLALVMTGCANKPVENAQIQDEAIDGVAVIPKEGTLTNEEKTRMEKYKDIKQVSMKTNKGEIKIELDWDNAPISVGNFLAYVDEGFYNETIFHRVIKGFMIQGGGFTADSVQKETHDPIKNEAGNGLSNDRGTLAMARTGIVDSATSQFFINLVDNDFLNHRDETPNGYGYAVFGKVVEGMDVVDAIAKVDTGVNGPHNDWPIEDVVIESVEFVK